MKEFAKHFYLSKAWKQCRDAYAESQSYLCEDCKARGRRTKGVIVHHIINLTPENIDDPNITLNWNNLKLVCRDCHAEEHGAYRPRYYVDKDGKFNLK